MAYAINSLPSLPPAALLQKRGAAEQKAYLQGHLLQANVRWYQVEKICRFAGAIFLLIGAIFGAASLILPFFKVTPLFFISSGVFAVCGIALMVMGASFLSRKHFWHDASYRQKEAQNMVQQALQKQLSYGQIVQLWGHLIKRFDIPSLQDINEMLAGDARNLNYLSFVAKHGMNSLTVLDDRNKNALRASFLQQASQEVSFNPCHNLALQTVCHAFSIQIHECFSQLIERHLYLLINKSLSLSQFLKMHTKEEMGAFFPQNPPARLAFKSAVLQWMAKSDFGLQNLVQISQLKFPYLQMRAKEIIFFIQTKEIRRMLANQDYAFYKERNGLEMIQFTNRCEPGVLKKIFLQMPYLAMQAPTLAEDRALLGIDEATMQQALKNDVEKQTFAEFASKQGQEIFTQKALFAHRAILHSKLFMQSKTLTLPQLEEACLLMQKIPVNICLEDLLHQRWADMSLEEIIERDGYAFEKYFTRKREWEGLRSCLMAKIDCLPLEKIGLLQSLLAQKILGPQDGNPCLSHRFENWIESCEEIEHFFATFHDLPLQYGLMSREYPPYVQLVRRFLQNHLLDLLNESGFLARALFPQLPQQIQNQVLEVKNELQILEEAYRTRLEILNKQKNIETKKEKRKSKEDEKNLFAEAQKIRQEHGDEAYERILQQLEESRQGAFASIEEGYKGNAQYVLLKRDEAIASVLHRFHEWLNGKE